MIAPNLTRDLLSYYVFKLSKSKGKTSRYDWQGKIAQIGNDMASYDGYSREYGGSLIRLSDITNIHNKTKLEEEFRLGISTRPEHISFRLDLERRIWLEKITEYFNDTDIIVIKGASGQGKTALCYRYLYNEYAPENVFCIRAIKDQSQAENLIKAIIGLTKNYTEDLIIYIDVNPGETSWTWILREAQIRSMKLKILISVREEDFILSSIDTSLVSLKILDVHLEKEEANWIYNTLTSQTAHPIFRTFDDAWNTFGESGPLLEFIFLLKNNQTLKQRLQTQVRKLMHDAGSDAEEWILLLRIVCYASQYGCPSLIANIKNEKICNNLFSALDRMYAEYLIRNSLDGRYIEALHPIRAKVLYDILKDAVLYPESGLILSCISYSEKHYVKILLLNYFIEHDVDDQIIIKLSEILYQDWEAYSGVIDTMLWLDVRSFINKNNLTLDWLIKEKGQGWLCFAPLDVSGYIRPNETMAEKLNIVNPKILEEASRIKSMFTSLALDYHFIDLWLSLSSIPIVMPFYDIEWMFLGYSLFWMSKRGKYVNIFFDIDNIMEDMKIGTIEYKAAALYGFFYQHYDQVYNKCSEILLNRVISEHSVIYLSEDEMRIKCGFVPPILSDNKDQEVLQNFNHYWSMKMVSILSHIYPLKPYVEVSLIGVDLFSELGIQALDYIKNISLENRPDKWVTRINAWFKNLVDFKYRPNNWFEYVNNIQSIRKLIMNAFIELTKEIDNLYERGHIKNNKAIQDMFVLRNKLQLLEILLPTIVVDKFGMFGEGNNADNILKESSNLSIYETSDFRKEIRNIISSVQNFANQFFSVLVSRKNNNELDNGSHLSEFNIYSATKSLLLIQKYFIDLFAI